jgi:hydroxymethylpyrimidine pyrophosphatase-like HAD family hydrolase
MSFKALAIDLDGTLLVGEEIPQRNIDALQAAQAAGFTIIIATARWLPMATRVQSRIKISGPVIACSGAQVHIPETGKDIFDQRLPEDFTRELFAICNAERCVATITVDDRVLVKLEGKPSGPGVYPEMTFLEALPASQAGCVRVGNIQGGSVYRRISDELKPRYGDQVHFFDSISPSGKTILTITSRLASKGTALDSACAHLGISPASVVAFGDAENDIEMFRVAGASVAMGQADARTQAAATWVTTRNDEAGVAVAVERLLLRGSLR